MYQTKPVARGVLWQEQCGVTFLCWLCPRASPAKLDVLVILHDLVWRLVWRMWRPTQDVLCYAIDILHVFCLLFRMGCRKSRILRKQSSSTPTAFTKRRSVEKRTIKPNKTLRYALLQVVGSVSWQTSCNILSLMHTKHETCYLEGGCDACVTIITRFATSALSPPAF